MNELCCPNPEPTPPTDRRRTPRLAFLARALADETRLALLERLVRRDEPLCVCHLVEIAGVSQPTVSHHLRILREAGLVTVERRGTWSYYRATPLSRSLLAALERAILSSVSHEDGSRQGGASRSALFIDRDR